MLKKMTYQIRFSKFPFSRPNVQDNYTVRNIKKEWKYKFPKHVAYKEVHTLTIHKVSQQDAQTSILKRFLSNMLIMNEAI